MLTDTIAALRDEALAADDAAGYFPAMYARVTDQVRQAVADGRFDDGARMLRFAETFASWYLEPRAGRRPAPSSWAAAWDVTGNERLVIVQHLFLGMNAHINHDLPQVVVELAGDDDIQRMRSDFDGINQVLADTYPDIIRAAGRVSAWVTTAASWGGGKLFNFSLTVARGQAWDAAVRLHALDAEARRRDVAEIDRLASVLAYLVTRPTKPFGWMVGLARRLEEHDPTVVTRSLLGDLA